MHIELMLGPVRTAAFLTAPFTLQYVAGHDNIKDDYALCSPQANTWEAVPCPGRTEAQSRFRIRCSGNCPSQTASVSN